MMSQEVHPIPPLTGAAVEQWIDAVAHRLLNYEPHLVSIPHPQRPDEEVLEGVHYRRIRMGRVYKRLFRKITRLDPYSYTDRILRYARSIRPAIVHIHNAPQFVAAIAHGLPGARLILHMHNEKRDSVNTSPAALVGCSNYIREWYKSRNYHANRFDVLDNGVDLAAFDSERSNDMSKEIRRQYGIPDDRFIILYVGRISPEKGPDLAVQVMKHLDPSRFHLVLVGEWPVGQAERSTRVAYAQSVQAILDDVPNTVIGAVAPGEMARMYLLGDMLLIPSQFEEPFSMVAIEAMAARLPVMALRKGGMVEYMRDRQNALLVDPTATPVQIADAVIKASGNPGLLRQISDAARNLVEARFSWDNVAKQTESLYGQLLSEKGIV